MRYGMPLCLQLSEKWQFYEENKAKQEENMDYITQSLIYLFLTNNKVENNQENTFISI